MQVHPLYLSASDHARKSIHRCTFLMNALFSSIVATIVQKNYNEVLVHNLVISKEENAVTSCHTSAKTVELYSARLPKPMERASFFLTWIFHKVVQLHARYVVKSSDGSTVNTSWCVPVKAIWKIYIFIRLDGQQTAHNTQLEKKQ